MNDADHSGDASRHYWKAAISALPTAEQRNAAWEFYVDKFGTDPRAGDTLSGLVLLLEANGVFLLTLPKKFHNELVRPMVEQLGAFRKELHDYAERERAALTTIVSVNDALKKANQHLDFIIDELFDMRAAAIQHIDATQLAKELNERLREAIVVPLNATLSHLPEQSKRIAAAAKAAECSTEIWRKVHLGGIVFNAWITAFLVCGLLFGLALLWLQGR